MEYNTNIIENQEHINLYTNQNETKTYQMKWKFKTYHVIVIPELESKKQCIVYSDLREKWENKCDFNSW